MSNPAELNWFKSSYSGSQGDSCIEVAMDFRKSSYSTAQGDDCVEVATLPGAVHVRDSKDTTIPSLCITPAAWSAFIAHAPRQGRGELRD
ncbi:DUF397 domain-containing protein [Streptomyces sp. A73]|uniref:DUF397 domain-containing protein n=1 Tax=Streptomyces TaxID=1883 RepID=UPI00160DA5D6|nr:DUF397 domain-containing protein [Streptomyces sp. RK75]MBQ0862681.1 DUF397 domain-containing protein [Streptomyces sp. RK75]MBQ1159904.1 DUF397 domain-containing protein [Streptomyces sp. A73]